MVWKSCEFEGDIEVLYFKPKYAIQLPFVFSKFSFLEFTQCRLILEAPWYGSRERMRHLQRKREKRGEKEREKRTYEILLVKNANYRWTQGFIYRLLIPPH